MTPDYLQFAIDRLPLHQGHWPEIARECDVSYSWLCKVAADKIPDPGHKKLKRIAEYIETLEKNQ